MTTLTIKIPNKVEKTLADLIVQLGGEVLITENDKVSKSVKKKQILNDLEESVNWVKQHQDGKVEAKSIQQLLDEL